ncbi:MAG TPA: hypothetical protein VIZ68_03870, partial [Thermoplasmata archaeon]
MERILRLVEARTAVAETLRLLDEFDRESEQLPTAQRDWMGVVGRERRERLRRGAFVGVVWVGPKDEAIGFADWSLPAEIGRRVYVFLSQGFRLPATLSAFVSALDVDGRLLGVHEPVLGFEADQLATALTPLGFSRVLRIDMVYPTDRPLPPRGPWV